MKPLFHPDIDDVAPADIFAALADPIRRGIVARLAVGDATVGELAAPYDVSVQAVSKHLRVLADAGLVSQRRDAQRRPCHLEAAALAELKSWIERYRQQAQERFARLDAVLAAMADPPHAHTHDTRGPQQQGAEP